MKKAKSKARKIDEERRKRMLDDSPPMDEERVKKMSEYKQTLIKKGVYEPDPNWEQTLDDMINQGMINVGKDGRLYVTRKGDIHYGESIKEIDELLKEDDKDE